MTQDVTSPLATEASWVPRVVAWKAVPWPEQRHLHELEAEAAAETPEPPPSLPLTELGSAPQLVASTIPGKLLQDPGIKSHGREKSLFLLMANSTPRLNAGG